MKIFTEHFDSVPGKGIFTTVSDELPAFANPKIIGRSITEMIENYLQSIRSSKTRIIVNSAQYDAVIALVDSMPEISAQVSVTSDRNCPPDRAYIFRESDVLFN